MNTSKGNESWIEDKEKQERSICTIKRVDFFDEIVENSDEIPNAFFPAKNVTKIFSSVDDVPTQDQPEKKSVKSSKPKQQVIWSHLTCTGVFKLISTWWQHHQSAE